MDQIKEGALAKSMDGILVVKKLYFDSIQGLRFVPIKRWRFELIKEACFGHMKDGVMVLFNKKIVVLFK